MSDPGIESQLRAAGVDVLERLRDDLPQLEPSTQHARVGELVSVADGVVRVRGLTGAFIGEVLDIGGATAVVEGLDGDQTLAVLLEDSAAARAGSLVRRLRQALEVPVGPGVLGRVVDPLGRPLDMRGPVAARRRSRVHAPPPPLTAVEPVTRPLRTGVFAVDTMLPIGCGQRQLIIGDRDTGKTDLALDVLAAMDRRMVGVYVAIGCRGARTAARVAWLRETGVLARGVVVATDADDPPGLQHLAPYAACAMAEALVDEGRDVVVVYDDLTRHADVHRSLALLLGRPVGREAHPVDVFYAHARLLERAGQRSAARGGGSLTAFPVVETQLGDMTGYIPTNLVSITDGQVRLDAALAAADVRPPVDVALSVSRVGGKAQPPVVRRLSSMLSARYAQFLELESFARFGTRLEASAQSIVDWGRRVRRVLRQPRGTSMAWTDTIVRLLLVGIDGFEGVAESSVDDLVARATTALLADPRVDRKMLDHGTAPAQVSDDLRKVADEVLTPLLADAAS